MQPPVPLQLWQGVGPVSLQLLQGELSLSSDVSRSGLSLGADVGRGACCTTGVRSAAVSHAVQKCPPPLFCTHARWCGSQVRRDATPLIAALVTAVESTSLSADEIISAAWEPSSDVKATDFAQVFRQSIIVRAELHNVAAVGRRVPPRLGLRTEQSSTVS